MQGIPLARWFAASILMTLPQALMAQTVFFDDFDGNALLPHWNQPPPHHWEYNVSNSMLNVTGLFYPSSPKSGGNSTLMNALFAPQGDFRMDAWMGWDAVQRPQRLAIWVAGPYSASPIIAEFGYSNESWRGPLPVIFTGSGASDGSTVAAPDPGIHHFTIVRAATQFEFYLDSAPVATFPDRFGTPAAAVWFEFGGPYPGPQSAFHVDRIEVVPAPGTLVPVLTIVLGAVRRKRR